MRAALDLVEQTILALKGREELCARAILSAPFQGAAIFVINPGADQEGKYMQWLYLIAAILGTILPLCFFVPFLLANGLDISAFLRQLFQNQVSSAFGVDVFISSIVLWLFVFSEGKRRGMKNLWAYVLCNLLFGVSSGLPFFLYFRERTMKDLSHSTAL